MTKLLRLSLLALALGAPMVLTAPAGAASPAAPFEEVAQAGSGTQARPQTRQRRPSAQAQRRNRQTAAQRTRRARAAQG